MIEVQTPTFAAAHKRLVDHSSAVAELLEVLDGTYEPAIHMLLTCLGGGGKILTCGNGGSHAQAAHMAAELTVRFDLDRRALAAVCLSGEPTALTAAGNDYGYHRAFARQVEALGRSGDVLVVFSTSGKSASCREAIAEAHARGVLVLGIAGRKGFELGCDIEIIAPGSSTAIIQEMHLLLVHMLVEGLERGVPS